jgi:hypothetical protein
MYVVNKDSNNINQINPMTFGEAGFKERQHLQEWIAKNPLCLGEDLLIIQKEFAGISTRLYFFKLFLISDICLSVIVRGLTS